MHELIHDEGSTCHVARVFHQRDEEVEYQNLWQKDDDGPYSTYHTVHQHVLQRTVRHRAADKVAQPPHTCVYPVHGILSEDEGCLEHEEEDEEEDGESQVFVRQDVVYDVSGLVGILLVAGLEMCFRQRSVDESVLGIHDSRLGVAVGFFKDTGSSLVALDEDGLATLSGLLAHETLDICVVFQQFQRHITR